MIRACKKISLLILPLLLLISSVSSIDCSAELSDTVIPDDAVMFESHYYKIYDDVAGFEKASVEMCEKFCEKRGGHLAVINSEQEDKFLYSLCTGSGYSGAFFGLRYKDSKWKWVNGQKLEYTNWAEDKPNGKKAGSFGQYSYISQEGEWNNGVFGTDGTVYICEWDEGTRISDAREEDAEASIDKKKSKRHSDSYYRVFDIALERGEAARLCINLGGHLAYITDKDEQKFVSDLIDKNGSKNMYWIGAVLEDSGWCWQNGQDMEDYDAWTKKKPDNTADEAYFAVINNSLKKYDIGSWVKEPAAGSSSTESENYINYGFVCEWEVVCKSDEGEFISHVDGQWQEVSQSSCTAPGKRLQYCKRCGETAREEAIAPLGHDYVEKALFIPGYTKLVCTKCNEHSHIINKGLIWIMPFLVIMYFIIMAAYLKARSDFERYARSKGIEIKTKSIPLWVFVIPPAVYAVLEGVLLLISR